MTASETAALVALLRLARRPEPVYAELIEQQGSARAVLERELAETDEGQANLLPDHDRDELLGLAATDVAAWEAAGMTLLTVLDRGYPRNLRAVHDRPPLLFVAGSLKRRDARSVAVIGSRAATPAGIGLASEIASHLADNDYTVISGLAAGIDTAAHTAALATRNRTVAVIGTGLAHAYPPENTELQRVIADSGAVVSQFLPNARASRKSFPLRNAVMSGLALGTVVVEASQRSGARVQARLALAHGRPVFLAQRLLDQSWAQALAGRPGTHVFRRPDEISTVIEQLTSTGALVA